MKTIQVQTNKEFEEIIDFYFSDFPLFMSRLRELIEQNKDNYQKINYLCELLCSHSMHETLDDETINSFIRKSRIKISDYNYLNNAIYAKWLTSTNIKESYKERRTY
jgi:hypothetical protein